MGTGGAGDRAEQMGRALAELIRRPEVRTDDPALLLDRVPIGALVELACYHRVPGVVYRALAGVDIDAAALEELRSAYRMATAAHARCLVELAAAAEVLGGLAMPWLVVKGPVLVELGYRDPGARLYEDLDLVVAAADLPMALALLEAAGGHVTDLNWPMMAKLRRAEIPMILARGMLCDLHWHLLVTPNARSRFPLPMEELVDRRRIVPIGGTEVATLDAIDGLLYLCLHGSLSGGHQLVWLKDLDEMLEAEPTQWEEFVRRARRYGLDLVAAIQLERARTVLGAAVPEPVVESLAGNAAWWRTWRWKERRVGMARWGGYDRTGRTLVAATSKGSLRSVAQLGRSLAFDVVGPAVAQRWSSSAEPEGDAPPLYKPAGPVAPRSEYLDLVSSGAWG
jgi:hypothetical protein